MATALAIETYQLRSNGQQGGPFSSDQIAMMMRAGQITTQAEIFLIAQNAWVPLAQIQEFAQIIPTPTLSLAPPLPGNQSANPWQANTSSQPRDVHYEQNVFPLVANGKRTFNWWACLFGIYWFAYKRMWSAWFAMILVTSVISPLAQRVGGTVGSLVVSILIYSAIGSMANSQYLKHYQVVRAKGEATPQGSVFSGILGVIAGLALVTFVYGFTIGAMR